jgi:hypothetical protein
MKAFVQLAVSSLKEGFELFGELFVAVAISPFKSIYVIGRKFVQSDHKPNEHHPVGA